MKLKRLPALALAAVMALSCAACGIRPSPAELAAAQSAANAAARPEALSPEGSVLFEKDGLKVTAAGLDTDPCTDGARPILWVDVENTDSADACLGVKNCSVNGVMTDAVLIEYCEEDGQIVGSSENFDVVVPALGTTRYALGYYRNGSPGVELDTLGEMELCFSLAQDEFSWPDYYSQPVTIRTGERVEPLDIAALGTVVIDDERLLLVIGQQDYDEVFGPMVYVYAENRSESWLGLSAELAEADGVKCDYIMYGQKLAPGKKAASFMCFDGEVQELRGFEDLTVTFSTYEAATGDALEFNDAAPLAPVSVHYPPQVWGIYDNGGLHVEIQPKYNDLITVETPQNDPDGILLSVSETASLQAGGHEGAGWLFSIGKISEEKLHEMLGYDMSGARVFAFDDEGNYYVYYHPTDVRFERATAEEMNRDAEVWSMLCQWADNMPEKIVDTNGLEYTGFDNSEISMYLARAAWQDAHVTLSTTEFGPVEAAGVDGSPYAELLIGCFFDYADPEETPDGEYVVLNFPEEDTRLDFFFAPGNYVRVVSGEVENLYQAIFCDDESTCAETMQAWYYAAAEHAGVKAPSSAG